jgi:hypothetical protein
VPSSNNTLTLSIYVDCWQLRSIIVIYTRYFSWYEGGKLFVISRLLSFFVLRKRTLRNCDFCFFFSSMDSFDRNWQKKCNLERKWPFHHFVFERKPCEYSPHHEWSILVEEKYRKVSRDDTHENSTHQLYHTQHIHFHNRMLCASIP